MKIVLTFLLFLNFGFVYAQGKEDNVNRELYKSNKVKSITIYKNKNKRSKPGRREQIDVVEKYDTNGLIVEYFSYHNGFILGDYHQQFKYDSSGKIIEDIGFVLKDEPVSDYYTYSYDEKKRVIEKRKDKQETWIYTYDSIGNISSQKWLFFGYDYPNTFFLDSFQYDSKRQLVKMTRYREGKTIYFYKTYEYDNVGNKIREIRFEHGAMTDVWAYTYDENGHLKEWIYYDGLMNKTDQSDFGRVYDKNGLIISDVQSRHYRRYVYEYY